MILVVKMKPVRQAIFGENDSNTGMKENRHAAEQKNQIAILQGARECY